MKKNVKKGFTITELVIVIAVIAVLAAVMIPTFAGIVKKAKQSADEQAVSTMNKVLSVETDTPDSIAEVIELLAEESLDIEDYKPLTKDTYFYWVKSENAIVIANSSNEVVYPKDYTDLSKTVGDWYTLSGETPEDNSWAERVTNGAVDIANGAQFVSLMKEVVDGNKANAVTTVNLTGDVDVMGSTYNFGEVTEDLTINGKGNTIYGLRSDSNNYYSTQKEYADKGYYYGVIPQVKAGATVTVSGLTISGMTVEDTKNSDSGSLGFIAGIVEGTLNISNVTIENSTIVGGQKVAALVGHAIKGTVNLTNVTVKNTTVKGDVEVAQLIGQVGATTVVTATNVTVENVTTAFRAEMTKSYTQTTAPALDGVNANDTFVTWNAEKAPYIGWVYAGVTQNWYWYSKTGLPTDRLYGTNMWSSSAAKA